MSQTLNQEEVNSLLKDISGPCHSELDDIDDIIDWADVAADLEKNREKLGLHYYLKEYQQALRKLNLAKYNLIEAIKNNAE